MMGVAFLVFAFVTVANAVPLSDDSEADISVGDEANSGWTTSGWKIPTNPPTQVWTGPTIEVPDISASDKAKIMNYIKVKTTEARLPFCWRQSYGRGVGTIPGRVADCPATYTNNGATCGRNAASYSAPSKLADCPSGYTNMGLTCYKGPSTYSKGCTTIFKKFHCKSGYTDNGCFCGRGASSLSASSMVCPSGYFRSTLSKRCHQHCRAGYTNEGEHCIRHVSTLGMSRMLCKSGEERHGARCFPKHGSCFGGEEEDAGLCYKKCKARHSGVGPVCWQDCPSGWVNCGAGCAESSSECAMVVADQVLAPLIVAANVATLGLAAPASGAATAGVQTLKVGGKMLTSSTKTGKALIKCVNALQTVKKGTKATTTVKKTSLIAKTGKAASTSYEVYGMGQQAYDSTDAYLTAYAEDFKKQTSDEINDYLDKHFETKTSNYLKMMWGQIQLAEMASTNGWTIAQNTLAVASMVDISGVTGLVSAYAKPVCQDHITLGCLASMKTC